MARFDMDVADQVSGRDLAADGQLYYQLGLQSASGRSRPVDLVEAHKWFNLAVMQGFRDAAERRAELAREMSREEVAEALRQARAFVTRH